MPVLTEAPPAPVDLSKPVKPISLPPNHPPVDFDPLAIEDPELVHQEYDVLRARCPVAWTNAYGGYWMLTRHADIKAAASDHASFISSVKAVVPSDPRGLRRPPLNTDPPAHTPFRRALDRTLKPTRIKKLAPRLERRALDELEPLLDAGEGDMAEFAARFAAWVEVEWINLDEEIAPELANAASSFVMAWRDGNIEGVGVNSKRLYRIAEDTLADRIAKPRNVDDDPASSLLEELDEDGELLDRTQVLGALRQSLVVGMVAPPIIIGSIVQHLSKDADLQEELRRDSSKIPAAVDEFVRLYTPYRGFARTVSHELSIHNRTIRPGEPVTMTYAAANRDPQVFDRPHEFIMNRPNISQHLGFGVGKHRCAGMVLARLLLEVALRVLLQNTKSIRVLEDKPVEFSRMPELGLSRCPVALESA